MPLVAQNGIAKVMIVLEQVSFHLKLFRKRGSSSLLVEPDVDMLGRTNKEKLQYLQYMPITITKKNK